MIYIQMYTFRPSGSPAGTHPAVPWWVSAMYDPYEKINVWSHLVPGMLFPLIALATKTKALAFFSLCAATTHILSGLTHMWPEDKIVEKMDHIGIVVLIVGTPFTAAMAQKPNDDRRAMGIYTLALLAAAFMRPLLRTILFAWIGIMLVLSYPYIIDANLGLQALLYLIGAICFLTNSGHNRTLIALADHHILHYLVTLACLLHTKYIMDTNKETPL